MPRKIPYDIPILHLFKEIVFMVAQLRIYTVAQAFRARAEEFLRRWHEINKMELDLIMDEIFANAHIRRVDEDLDTHVDDLSTEILIIVKKDRRDLLYLRYFGNDNPSILKRMAFLTAVERIRLWVPSLKEAPQESLKAIATAFETDLTEADSALAEQGKAWSNWDDFFKLGQRKLFIDELNTFRRTLSADLIKLVEEHPELGLPSDFDTRFFVKASSRQPREEPVETKEELRAQIEEAQARLLRLEEDEQTREAAEAQLKLDEARLAELESERQMLMTRIEKQRS